MNQDNLEIQKRNKREKIILFSLIGIIIIASILYFSLPKTDDTVEEESSQEEEEILDIPTMTAEEVQKMLLRNEEFVLLDVRRPIEYAEEHIKGATNISMVNLEDMKDYLPKDIPIVTMCDGSNCLRSTSAAENLIGWGFKNVKIFEGGTKGWKQEAYPLTVGVISEVKYFDIPKISATTLKEVMDTETGWVIYDVRSSLDFKEEHIPYAENISFADVEGLAQTNQINLDRKIIIYGAGNDVKSEMAAQTLLANGAVDISILADGYDSWKNKGYPIKKTRE